MQITDSVSKYIVNYMIMVTNNAKHFNRVEGITIENRIEE